MKGESDMVHSAIEWTLSRQNTINTKYSGKYKTRTVIKYNNYPNPDN